ncbi:phosphate/phosphite/phosphonate ABC transporter substrate-binding protein [Magnetospirillum sulfuroxidans]|uniref:Phosphate/phosphite/phosphonate ABC transporter substrate-binding protein n=1 Tax=Magnetospirillum sulfuroxidans TaxID=611300 RepID=A0ABS5IE26_9PROT|nr:phosphate/phosphite/phosphonate ABC transporter substrate-binding protein [Magnetospirillum sulfuroxidans]MBR9971958.1 phosphate/phosphite/phosphonate ABC transporter substrate-binding protein [Magnetospirillum sulfuroxidans]
MKTKFITLLCLFFLAFTPTSWGIAAEALRVGVVPQFDSRHLSAIWTPVLERLGRDTGLAFQLDIPPSIPAFEKNLDAGQYDLAYMNPYHFAIAHKRQGYEALVRDLAGDFSAIIVVARDSPITSVAMLAGKTVAFPSPNALAALLPRADFARTFHIAVTEKYTKTHSSAYLSVALGEADAGGGARSTFEVLDPQIKSRLRIVYESRHFPPHPLAAHPRVPPTLRQQITLAFLALATEPSGAELLAEIPMKHAGPAQSGDYAALTGLDLQAFRIDQ